MERDMTHEKIAGELSDLVARLAWAKRLNALVFDAVKLGLTKDAEFHRALAGLLFAADLVIKAPEGDSE